ncbi:GNAT family N-acetyltransferase, partial [Roseateles sp.]|uniref:GNAT family N-acetyltransferase n=1 Tax=Roseateles sp. TaxID=1971397 RepID=UPI002AA1BCA7|nr:GNAT family N-acetyltransferase [Roseateles sp.]
MIIGATDGLSRGGICRSVVALRDQSHLFHLFVAKAFQGQRLASKLWSIVKTEALQAGNLGEFTVNARFRPNPAPSKGRSGAYISLSRRATPCKRVAQGLVASGCLRKKFLEKHDKGQDTQGVAPVKRRRRCFDPAPGYPSPRHQRQAHHEFRAPAQPGFDIDTPLMQLHHHLD